MDRLGLLVAAIVALVVVGCLVAYLAPNLSIAGQFRPQRPIIRPSIEKLTCRQRGIAFAHVENHNLRLDEPVTFEVKAQVENLTEGWSPYLEIYGHLIRMKVEANGTVVSASYTLRNLTGPVRPSNKTASYRIASIPYKVCLVYNGSELSEEGILETIRNYAGNEVVCKASVMQLKVVPEPSIAKVEGRQIGVISGQVEKFHDFRFDKPVTLEVSAHVKNLTKGWDPYLEIYGHLVEMKEVKKVNDVEVLDANCTLRNLTRVPVWLLNDTIAVPYKVFLVYNGSNLSKSEILKEIKNYTDNEMLVFANASIIPLNISSVVIKDVPIGAVDTYACWAHARALAIGYYSGIYNPKKLTQIEKLLAYYKNFNEMELTLIEKYHFYDTRLDNYILGGCFPENKFIYKNGTFVWERISYGFPIKTEGLIPDLIALGYPTSIPISPHKIYYNGWDSGDCGHMVLGTGFKRTPSGIVYRVINYGVVHPLSEKFVNKKRYVDVVTNGTIPGWLADQAYYNYNEPLSLPKWLEKYG